MEALSPPEWQRRGYPDPYLPERLQAHLDGQVKGLGPRPDLAETARDYFADLPQGPNGDLWIPDEVDVVVLAAAQVRERKIAQRKDLDRARYGMTRALSAIGMWAAKRQLEDRLLELELPQRCSQLRQRLEAFQAKHGSFTSAVESSIGGALGKERIGAEAVYPVWCSVDGASRRLQALRLPNFDFAQPTDFFDAYVLLETVEDCYRALRAVHRVGRPTLGGFQDLIAAPHRNGFSGLTTRVQVKWFDEGGAQGSKDVNVILQTRLMHEVGWHGVVHPECAQAADRPLFIEELLANRGHLVGARPDIVVYAQGGHRLSREAHELKAGATVLDLAYKIHSAIGNEALSAAIDGKPVESLGQVLEDGVVVEIHRSLDKRNVRNEDDLELVTLPSSRRLLKRGLYRRGAAVKGRLTILQQLNERGFPIRSRDLDQLVESIAPKLPKGKLKNRTADGIYLDVARQQDLAERQAEAESAEIEKDLVRLKRERKEFDESISSGLVAAAVADEVVRVGFERLLPGDSPTDQWRPALAEDTESGIRLAVPCGVCHPGPNDEIVGRRRGSQVKFHVSTCRYASGKDILAMRWIQVEGRVRAILNISGVDRSRLVINVCECVAQLGCGLEQISARADHLGKARLVLHIYADSAAMVERLAKELGRVTGVAAVDREVLPLPGVGETRKGEDGGRHGLSRSDAMPLALHLRSSGRPVRDGLIRPPYDPQRPRYEGTFFGREDESDRLVRNMKTGAGPFLFISGPRTIGKSSLALRFCDMLDEEHRPHQLRVDLRDCVHSSSREAFEGIVAEFREQPYADPSVPEYGNPRKTLDALVEACDRHLLLVLDEFGGPLESFRSGRLGDGFFHWIRSAVDRRSPKLTLMMAGPPDAELFLRKYAQRDLGERIDTFHLGVLTADATRQMFTEPLVEEGISVRQDAIEAVIALCGGHPYYLIELLRRIVQRLNDDRQKWEVVRADVTQSLNDLLADDLPLSGWIAENAPTLSARICLDGLVRASGRKNDFVDAAKIAKYAQLDVGEALLAMERFQRCQAVEASESDPTEYRIMFPLLSEWIRRGGLRRAYFARLDGYPGRCLSAFANPKARKGSLTIRQIAEAVEIDRESAAKGVDELTAESLLTGRRGRYRLALPLLGSWVAEESRRRATWVGG